MQGKRTFPILTAAFLLVLAASCSDSPRLDSGLDRGGAGGGEAGSGGDGGSEGPGGAGAGGEGADGGSGGAGGEGGEFVGSGGAIDEGDGLLFWGRANGAPGPVWGVSSDQGSNAWAANGSELLFLPAGSEQWERFNTDDGLWSPEPISVTGAQAGVVFVGYKGLFPDNYPFDDPDEIKESGGVDRVVLDDGSLSTTHYYIFSPPMPLYPEGRQILRTCYRVVPVLSGPYAGDVWFACNHGVAMWNARFGIQEHQHPAINDDQGSLLVGDFRGLVVTRSGNVWVGGDERSGLIRYADEGGQFWARVDPEVDIWPPGVALDPGAHDWVMDMISDGADGIWVASFGNGVAHMAANGSWSYLTTLDGLPDNRVRALALDPDGSLWIGTDAGVARLLPGGRFGKGLDGLDGLLGSVLSVHVDSTTSPRRVLIGTSAGVGIYNGP